MAREILRLRDDWKFTRNLQEDAVGKECDDSGWEDVQVPHDWAIAGPFDRENDIEEKVQKGQADIEESVRYITGRTGGLPHVGEGWYRKVVSIPKENEKRIYRLECDGIMSHGKVYCNGEFAGTRPYGYSSFALDLTDWIRPGEDNVIAVHVNNPPKSSRWYPGAGIYREIRLVSLSPVHIAHWGVVLTTPEICDEKGKVNIRTRVENQGGEEKVELRTTIMDLEGNRVVSTIGEEKVDGSTEIEQSLEVEEPQKWSLENPTVYTAVSELIVNGKTIDVLKTMFGFRTLRFDANEGFFLNEQLVKMKGVCMHHDLGPLGAAVNREALKRQLVILQEMGCNAIRTSHNPPDPQLPELASEMGILLIEEAFDEWKYAGMENGSHVEWEEWGEKDMRDLIRRDRNFPAVIMWSTGNEISEQFREDGPQVSRFLTEICHDEDPTRPVTAGLNRSIQTIPEGFPQTVDIPGWNYQPHDYVKAHTMLPDRPMYGSETASTVSSRGEYFFPAVDEIHTKRDNLQVSSYDLCYAGWATAPDIEFRAQDEFDFIMGEFVWTGFDYLGEPTPYNEEWPSRSSYFGIVDLGGIPKDRFYLYQSQWVEDKMLHLMPHWTWPEREGQPVPVQCYTNHHEVEIFVNGKSYGRKSRYEKYRVLESNYRFLWPEVVYEPGELKVVAYDRKGEVLDEKSVFTSGEMEQIALTADRPSLKADGDDMAFITLKIVDKDGNLCPRANVQMNFEVEGPGKIEGLCNGDATSLESFKGSSMKTFNGMLVIYLRSEDGGEGPIRLKASGEGLESETVELRTD